LKKKNRHAQTIPVSEKNVTRAGIYERKKINFKIFLKNFLMQMKLF